MFFLHFMLFPTFLKKSGNKKKNVLEKLFLSFNVFFVVFFIAKSIALCSQESGVV